MLRMRSRVVLLVVRFWVRSRKLVLLLGFRRVLWLVWIRLRMIRVWVWWLVLRLVWVLVCRLVVRRKRVMWFKRLVGLISWVVLVMFRWLRLFCRLRLRRRRLYAWLLIRGLLFLFGVNVRVWRIWVWFLRFRVVLRMVSGLRLVRMVLVLVLLLVFMLIVFKCSQSDWGSNFSVESLGCACLAFSVVPWEESLLGSFTIGWVPLRVMYCVEKRELAPCKNWRENKELEWNAWPSNCVPRLWKGVDFI